MRWGALTAPDTTSKSLDEMKAKRILILKDIDRAKIEAM
jgi:hypothetical protein